MSAVVDFPEQCPSDVWALVVAYHPDATQLYKLCARLDAEGARVLVVDNTESPQLDAAYLPRGTDVLNMCVNTGIAHAQNIGVAKALSGGARIVVFFDQDSTFDTGFLPALVGALRPGVPEIVAPQCQDIDTEMELPSQRLSSFGRVLPVYCRDAKAPLPADIVISSGMAATREALVQVGTFDEDLFIDFVDTDWCLRCRSKATPIHVVPDAVMFHRIGSRSIKLGSRTIMVHSPVRCYYQIRNSLHLFRKRHVPLLFAIREMLSVLLNRLVLIRYVNDKGGHLKACAQGFRDGLRSVTGARKN